MIFSQPVILLVAISAILLLSGIIVCVKEATRKLGANILKIWSAAMILIGIAVIYNDLNSAQAMFRGVISTVLGAPLIIVGVIVLIACHFIIKKIKN